MGRPGVGNPGNKGGARHSAIVEKATGERVKALFRNDQDKEALIAKIQSGFYSGWDVVMLKFLVQMNDRVICDLLRKIVPDLIDVTTKGASLVSSDELLTRISNAKNSHGTDDP